MNPQMENGTIMDTSLNGIGLPSLGMVKKQAVPALLGAAGAGGGLFAVDKLMKYPLGTFGSLDSKLAGFHPALPGVARVGVAVVGVPAAAALAYKFTKIKVPEGAIAGATAVLALYGIVAAVNAVKPGTLQIPGLSGAALLTESVSGPFGGASLGVEEAGKFGGLGGQTGPGFASVMGASGHY